jgi:hypothetical protein
MILFEPQLGLAAKEGYWSPKCYTALPKALWMMQIWLYGYCITFRLIRPPLLNNAFHRGGRAFLVHATVAFFRSIHASVTYSCLTKLHCDNVVALCIQIYLACLGLGRSIQKIMLVLNDARVASLVRSLTPLRITRMVAVLVLSPTAVVHFVHG